MVRENLQTVSPSMTVTELKYDKVFSVCKQSFAYVCQVAK